jgi:phenylacetate-CoA ligase
MFDRLSIDPSSMKSQDDLQKLPIISRGDLIEFELTEPPFGGLYNPDEKIDRIFTSPGPVYEPHLSDTDMLWARAYSAAGLNEKDVVLNTFSYHMVAAGLTFHNGLRSIGATVVPSGTSSSQVQVQLIRDLGVTAYTGTPSFLLSIIRKAEEMGFNFARDFHVKRASFAAEPLEASLRKIFEDEYGIDTYQMYGATEVGDVAYECSERKGWHICENVIVEIVDPSTGRAVEPGLLGEVVVTRINSIFFLLRFGTGDLSRIILESCPCGRTSYRLNGIAGRIGDAIKIRGLFVATSQLRRVSEQFKARFQMIVHRTAHEDFLTIRLEKETKSADTRFSEADFVNYFREVCTVRVDRIEILKPGELGEGYDLFIDKRTWA